MDADLAREALTYQQTLVEAPMLPISHQYLVCLDENQPAVLTVPLDQKYDGTCGDNQWSTTDEKFKRCLEISYALRGRMTDQEIRDSITSPANPRNISAQEMAHARAAYHRLQNKNCSTGQGWLISFVESQVAWENFKVLLRNTSRLKTILARRVVGMSDAQYSANCGVSATLTTDMNDAKARCSAKIQAEIEGVSNGDIKVFKWKERAESGPLLQSFRLKEIARLKRLLTELQAWPEFEWQNGQVHDPQDDLGGLYLPVGKRSPGGRKTFWLRFAVYGEYLASANRAGLEAFEFIESLNQPRFFEWKVQQLANTMDSLFKFILLPRMGAQSRLYAEEVQYRLAVPDRRLKEYRDEYFQSIQRFFDMWNADSVARGQPPVSFAHMRISESVELR